MSDASEVRRRLGRRYRDGLRAVSRSLAALNRAQLAGDLDAIDSIVRLAHQLHGSGATYGHPDVSAAAARVMPGPGFSASVHALIATLLAIVPVATDQILVVDDSPEVRDELVEALAEFDVQAVGSVDAARTLIAASEPDLVLLDLNLDNGLGRTLLRELQEHPAMTRMPVVVHTTDQRPSTITECIAMGAEQFLARPTPPQVVHAIVSGLLARRRMNQCEARTDRLTGLPNRSGLEALFRRARSGAERSGRPLCAALLDLDGFKTINDKFGHSVGDATLVHVAVTLESSLRDMDTVGRWGGDEFVVIVEAELDDAHRVLSRASDALLAAPPELDGVQVPSIGFSAGLVRVAPGEGFDGCLARADVRLYQAKAMGSHALLACTPDFFSPRVLVVEDDPHIAAPLCVALTEAGYRVDHAADAASVPYETCMSAVVLDLSLPDGDGIDILKRLREHAPCLPALVLTASKQDEDLQRSFAAGIDAFVQKPASTQSIVVRVKHLLGRSGHSIQSDR